MLIRELGYKYYIYKEEDFLITAEDRVSMILFSMSFRINRSYFVIGEEERIKSPTRIYLRCRKGNGALSSLDKDLIQEILVMMLISILLKNSGLY